MKRLIHAFIFAILGIVTAKADTLSFVLDQTVLYGAPGSTVNFTGTVTNLTNAPVYITGNGDSFSYTVINPLQSYGIGPSYPFTTIALLGSGATTSDTVLLNVDIPLQPNNSVTFTGSLFGGATSTSNNNLGSFTVTLNSGTVPAPEIEPSLAASGLMLIAGALAIIRRRHLRTAA